MEPQIRYCTTSDGVSIAYYTMGEGPPLVVTSNVIWSHLRGQFIPEYHRSRSGRGLGRGLQIVRYDARGTGLSDRRSLDFSMDARLLDIEAVIARLKLERFALIGGVHGAPAAIAYAARHPQAVSHLVLLSAYISGRDYYEKVSELPMRDEDWERFTLNQANWILEFNDGDLARVVAAGLRESMTPESVRAFVAAMDGIDVRSLLPHIAAPTLVMYRQRVFNMSLPEWSRELASKIPNARFVEVAKRVDPRWTNEETRTVEEFLGVSQDTTTASPRTATSPGMTAILFADIVDSTALTERMGDTAFRAKARDLDASLRAIIAEAGGATIDAKTLGDGVLATFAAAAQAIEAALRCGAAGEAQGLPLHLGLHAGDVIREANNVFGGAVNIASRISAISAPGEVLVSDIVRGLARTSAGVTFEDRGEHALKGVSDVQRLFAVRKGGE